MSRLISVIRDAAFANRLNALIVQIPLLKNEGEVTQVLHEVVALLQCNGAVFSSFAREDDTFHSYKYFVACDPSWCNQYISQRWFMIDPALLYAQIHTEPIIGDDIPFFTGGQRLFRQKAREAGFESIAVVPAHSAGGRSRMGVLYLTSAEPDFFTQETLPIAKMFLRAIAAEILDWWINQVRARLLRQVDAKPDELELLKLVRLGHSTKEIAQMTGASPASLDQRFARLSARFNAPSRVVAAGIAYENGLLEN